MRFAAKIQLYRARTVSDDLCCTSELYTPTYVHRAALSLEQCKFSMKYALIVQSTVCLLAFGAEVHGELLIMNMMGPLCCILQLPDSSSA